MATLTSHVRKALETMLSDSGTLPAYEDEAIHHTGLLIDEFDQAISTLESEPEDNAEAQLRILIYTLYKERLEQGSELYLRSRLLRATEVSNSNHNQLPQSCRVNQTSEEAEFMLKYRKAVATFTKNTGVHPTADIRPPKGLNAEVKVLYDASSVLVGDSFLSLRKNQLLTLRSQQAQELEHSGIVQIVRFLK